MNKDFITIKQLKENNKISNFRTISYPLSFTRLIAAGAITVGCLITPATNWMIVPVAMWAFSPLPFMVVMKHEFENVQEKFRRWRLLR